MEPDSFLTLLTPAGQEVLREAEALDPTEAKFLRDFTRLSKCYPREVSRAALETAILRREAQVKFPAFSQQVYFTRAALEQATPGDVAAYRSARYAGFEHIFDLGCSVGMDTQALARIAPTTGVDLDPLRLQMARENCAALGIGLRTHFVHADLNDPLPWHPLPNSAMFFDPARRTEGRRIFSVRDYQPSLDMIRIWGEQVPAMGAKISPGVKLEELDDFECEVEFISLGGELKEAALWFGPLMRGVPRQATVLPGPHVLSGVADDAPAPCAPPQAYLYEPDPAVLRAGLVQTLAGSLGAYQLDPDIAYLTAPDALDSPFARRWQIEDWMPFNLKKLRAYLRVRDVGPLTVKRRGSPITPEKLIQDLRLRGEISKTLVLTHLEGRPIVIVCKDIEAS